MDNENMMNPMSTIFHEKQEGSLCAQHCLNALLQGNYFTAVDLADLAKDLDEQERSQMAEAGTQSAEYLRFMQQPSSNFDDSGFFSIQVLQRALRVWNLDLVPFTSSNEVARTAREKPRSQQAYICNFREHWFTIRKLGNQWFNLNSLLTEPELVSDTYLSLLLTQLQQEGYSIFLVMGSLPECEADQILKVIMAVQPIKPRLITDTKSAKSTGQASKGYDDQDLQLALAESKRFAEEDDQSLKRALAMSMEGLPPDYCFPTDQYMAASSSTSSAAPSSNTKTTAEIPATTPTPEEVREKRLEFYNKQSQQPCDVVSGQERLGLDDDESTNSTPGVGGSGTSDSDQEKGMDAANETITPTENSDEKIANISEISEEKMLELALKMSMEGDT